MVFTLKQKLAFLVAVVLVPLSIAVMYQLVHLYDHLRDESMERAGDEAELVVVRLEQLEDRMTEESWSAGKAVALVDLEGAKVRTYFSELSRRDPGISYALFARDGKRLSGGAPSGTTIVPAPPPDARTRKVTVMVTEGPPTERGVIVYVPVHDGAVTRIAASRATRPALDRMLPPSFTRGSFLVTDRGGNVIYSGPETILSDSQAKRLSTVRTAIEGRRGADPWMRFPGSRSRYVGVQIPHADLTVGFYNTAVETSRHITDEATLLTAAVLATVMLSAEFARRYANDILRDVARLRSASKRLAVGDFDVELPVGSRDEIGLLARDFSNMRASLQDAFASESTIAEAASKLGQATSIESIAEAALAYTARLLDPKAAALTVLEPDSEPRVFGWNGDGSIAYAAEYTLPYRKLGAAAKVERLPADKNGGLLASFPLRQSGALLGRIDVLLPHVLLSDAERSELELVSSIAGQTATALANIILYERERLIAETLQDSLLTVLPRDPELRFGLQYRPATVGMRIGGDFYDFVSTPQGMVVVVGDISGKGLVAARQTSVAKGALRSFAIDDPSPELVLSRANSAILPQFESGSFVTAFCALVDTSSEMLVYSTAGHPPPLLLHIDGTVETLLIGGPPLGIVEDAEYPLTRVAFEPEQTLVIVSDGITEARNAEGELFGEQSVAMVVAESAGFDAEKIASDIVEAAESHAEGRLEDDLTVVVVSFAQSRVT